MHKVGFQCCIALLLCSTIFVTVNCNGQDDEGDFKSELTTLLQNTTVTQHQMQITLNNFFHLQNTKFNDTQNQLQLQNDLFISKMDEIIASQQNSLATIQDELKFLKNIATSIQESINSLEVQNTAQNAKLRVVEGKLDNLRQTQNNRFLGLENNLLSLQTMNKKFSGQLLKAVLSTAKLPTKLSSHSVLYDGNDSIYIMGGWDGDSDLDHILVFSISSQTITRIGSLPSTSCEGMMDWDNFGNIFYFGGGSDYKQVYKFNTVTRQSSEMEQLPYDVRYGTSIKQNNSSNTVYILGGVGQGTELLSFDMKSLNFSKMTNLSFSTYPATSFSVGNNKAFIYGGSQDDGGIRTLFKMNLETFEMTPVGDPNHPKITERPSSVSDGAFGYLIGGYISNNSSIPTGGIIQFDPNTRNSKFIPIQNVPVQGRSYYEYSPKCVYVKSSNKIYCFGGKIENYFGGSYTSERQDSIFYIDLSPLRN